MKNRLLFVTLFFIAKIAASADLVQSWLFDSDIENYGEVLGKVRGRAILEYATGSNLALADAKSPVTSAFETDGSQTYLAIEFQEMTGADEVDLSALRSTDLSTWGSDTIYPGRTNNGDDTSTLRFSSIIPFTGNAREFLRIEASAKP